MRLESSASIAGADRRDRNTGKTIFGPGIAALLAILVTGLVASSAPAAGPAAWDAKLAEMIPKAMQQASIPGAIVGVCKDGEAPCIKAFGVRDTVTSEPMARCPTTRSAGTLTKTFSRSSSSIHRSFQPTQSSTTTTPTPCFSGSWSRRFPDSPWTAISTSTSFSLSICSTPSSLRTRPCRRRTPAAIRRCPTVRLWMGSTGIGHGDGRRDRWSRRPTICTSGVRSGHRQIAYAGSSTLTREVSTRPFGG